MENNNRTKKVVIYILSITSVLFILWLPFFLTFYPGVGMHDEIYCAVHPQGASFNQPFIYACILGLFYRIGLFFGSYTLGIGIFIFVKMFLTAMSISIVLIWLYHRGINKYILYFLGFYYALMPIVIDYSIAAVKDGPFAVVFMLMIPVIIKLADGKFTIHNKDIFILFLALSILMMWFRNNGYYIFLGMVVVFLLITRSSKKKILQFSLICLAMGILPTFVLSNFFHVKQSFTEAVSVPLQQICRVVYLNRPLPINDEKFINNFMEVSAIKKQYNQDNVDNIKWAHNYNRRYVDSHKKLFFKTWVSLLKLYPQEYLDAWFYTTRGYWYYLPWINREGTKFGHAYDEKIFLTSNKVGMANGYKVSSLQILPSHLKDILGKYVWDYSIFLPSSICLWMTILIGIILFYQKKYLYSVVLLPSILCSLTLIVAAPLSNCFRYTFYYVLCLPIFMVLPLLVNQKE